MEIVVKKITRNITYRAIPVATNHLVRSSSGALHWKRPNNYWASYSNTGGNCQIISNIQFDDSKHSPDLFIYSNVTNKDRRSEEKPYPHKRNTVSDLAQANRIQIDLTRNWYIKQLTNIDRVGVQRFTQLPVQAFLKLWRVPLDPKEITIADMRNQLIKFKYQEFEFNMFLKWPEWRTGLPWLKKHCRGGIFLFSDYTSMFEEQEDEFLYIADIC